MWYPQNGSIANGSRRSSPSPPKAAAVFSEPIVAAMNTPWFQSRDSNTSGTVLARRPPNRNAEIGTPFTSSYSGATIGHWSTGTQKREFGCAAGFSHPGDQSLRCQSRTWSGGGPSIPSHQTSPSSVSAVFVNTVLRSTVAMAFGFVSRLVPGATPKNPFSGLMAYRRPSAPNFIHAMSSPTHSAFQPGIVGISIARLVLPQADGNAAPM